MIAGQQIESSDYTPIFVIPGIGRHVIRENLRELHNSCYICVINPSSEAEIMLLRFAVANHLSISAEQELSFAASSLRDQSDGLIECQAVPTGAVLPALVIYGANASGKTNLVNALASMKNFVLWSHTRGEPGGGVPRNAFKLDPAKSKEPSRFDIDFIIDDIRYHYGFEVTDEVVAAEWLYALPGSHRRRMFERNGTEFNFGRWLKGQNSNIAGLTRPNSLLLSVAAQNGHEQLSKIYQYFNAIEMVASVSMPSIEAQTRFRKDGLDSRVIDFLNSINTGVTGYRKKEIYIPEEARRIRRELQSILGRIPSFSATEDPGDEEKLVAIELAHRGRDGKSVYFDLDLESAGTQRLLIVLSLAYEALDRGIVLCVDELNANLHTYAAAAILKLFSVRKNNQKGAQLIATTHDTNLMRSPVLRRDQLWFTEKNADGATELYPLTDIRTRKGDNVELGYLQGRYGALPGNDPLARLCEFK